MRNKINYEIDWSLYCAIIPVYNSEATLPILVNTIQDLYPELEIIIIDDGSEQSVENVIDNREQVIEIIRHAQNRGKGKALRSGIQKAQKIDKKFGIFLDSDLQHSPQEIIKYIHKRLQTKSDIILGMRDLDNTMPFHRILSNSITSFLISLRTGMRVHDSQCGFRLLNLTLIEPEHYNYDGFQFEGEFLIKQLNRKCRFAEVEIRTIYNKHGSNMENIKDTLRFIKMYLESYFW